MCITCPGTASHIQTPKPFGYRMMARNEPSLPIEKRGVMLVQYGSTVYECLHWPTLVSSDDIKLSLINTELFKQYRTVFVLCNTLIYSPSAC